MSILQKFINRNMYLNETNNIYYSIVPDKNYYTDERKYLKIDYSKIEQIMKENLKELGKNKKYFVKTYGCQMNEHDSENIKAILERKFFRLFNVKMPVPIGIFSHFCHEKTFIYLTWAYANCSWYLNWQ